MVVSVMEVKTAETRREEDVLPPLTGRMRVMTVRRGDGRSAFDPDLCSHDGVKGDRK